MFKCTTIQNVFGREGLQLMTKSLVGLGRPVLPAIYSMVHLYRRSQSSPRHPVGVLFFWLRPWWHHLQITLTEVESSVMLWVGYIKYFKQFFAVSPSSVHLFWVGELATPAPDRYAIFFPCKNPDIYVYVCIYTEKSPQPTLFKKNKAFSEEMFSTSID